MSNIWMFCRSCARKFHWSDRRGIINARFYVTHAFYASCIVYLFHHMNSDVENNLQLK